VARPEKLNAVPGHKVYVVFSDFEDNSSRNKLENVIEFAHEGRVAIFPVLLINGFGENHPRLIEKRIRQNAQKIADETGGQVLIPESPDQLAATFERLGSELRAVYRISYTPSSMPVAGRKKKLRMETTRPQVKLLFPKN
jgi:hypothetical protein